jgi:aminomethyltransferase
VSDTYNTDEQAETPETQTLPLDSWHRAQGGRMVEFAGYYMPVQYEGILAEHLWTRENAGLFDVSHMGQLYLSGDGLDAAVEAVLPIDLSTLKTGAVRYSLLLNDEGGVLDDLMVTRWQSGLYMVVNGATKWDDIGHLREFLPDEITLSHLEDSALLALQGPQAAAALATLAPDVATLGFMQGAAFQIEGIDAWISRSGYTGEDGFEISIPAQNAAQIVDALTAHPLVKPIGLGARDSLRLEAGLPLYGHDLNENQDPISAGLTFGINKRRRSQGGFPGAEKIQHHLAHGTPTTRIGLTLEGRQAAREGATIYLGDTAIGIVTSGGFAPSLGVPIAMGDVLTAHAAPGTALTIDVRGKRLPATVTKMPFVPHRYIRKGAAQ